QSGFVVDNLKRDQPHPRLRTCISDMSGNGKLPVSGGEIGKSFNVNPLHKCLRRYEQLNRPIDTPVVRPVAGTSSRHHVFIECIIHAHYDHAGLSPTEQMSDNAFNRSEEHTSELQSRGHLVCRLLLEKKK